MTDFDSVTIGGLHHHRGWCVCTPPLVGSWAGGRAPWRRDYDGANQAQQRVVGYKPQLLTHTFKVMRRVEVVFKKTTNCSEIWALPANTKASHYLTVSRRWGEDRLHQLSISFQSQLVAQMPFGQKFRATWGSLATFLLSLSILQQCESGCWWQPTSWRFGIVGGCFCPAGNLNHFVLNCP